MTLFAGCEGDESAVVDSGAAYFPLWKGLYHIYRVDEVRYTVSAPPEELHYEVMTEVADSFPSGADAHTFVVHRSLRAGADSPWEELDTWSVRLETDKVVVSEGNIPFVKLLYPVREGVRWNGNSFNTLGEDEYHYDDIGRSLELDGTIFEKTMTVEQEFNDDTIVYYDTRKEVYALHTGLVYKEVTQLAYCTEDQCLGQQKIDHGMALKMVITEYGTR